MGEMREAYRWNFSTDAVRSILSETDVSLLSDESYVNNNDTLLLRSTTYEPKYVEPTPLLKGSLYVHFPGEIYQENEDVDVSRLTLSQLYSIAYLPHMQQRLHQMGSESPILSCPPDFDSETPTDPEDVLQYIKELSTAAYHGEVKDPSPFQLYESLVSRCMENISALSDEVNASNGLNSASRAQSLLLNSHDECILGVASDSGIQSFNPEADVNALAISMWLSNISHLDNFDVVLQELETFPSASVALRSSVVNSALNTCRTLVMGDVCPQTRKEGLCTLLGFVVLSRGNIREILDYVGMLEEYFSNSKFRAFPIVLPRCKEMLRCFALRSPKQYTIIYPVDAHHYKTLRLPIMLSEGTRVFSFCVSPCGQFLAAATVCGILLFDVDTGRLLTQSHDVEMACSSWILQFVSDSTNLVVTMKTGLRHVILSSTLEYISEHKTDHPAIPATVKANSIDFLFSPQLPSGRKSSVFLVASGKIVLDKLGSGADKRVESFVICTHLHSDFVGRLVSLGTADGTFTLSLDRGVVTLSQGSCSCFGVFPNQKPWHFLYCQWSRGVWTLGIDGVLVELRGTRTTHSRTIKFVDATVLDGTGHVASLVAWCGSGHDGHAIREFASRRVLESTLNLLLYLPMDEGEGLWLKELATMRALTMSERCLVWDDAACCPCSTPATLDHDVSIPQHQFLQADVMVSDYQVLIAFPSTDKGGDRMVVAVQQVGTQCISRVYRCTETLSPTLHFLSRNESLLYTFQQRFSTFTVTSISTTALREHRLIENGILQSDDTRPDSPEWLCNEVFRRICIDGDDLLRISEEINPLRVENLQYLSVVLAGARDSVNRVKLVAVMTLAIMHMNRLALEEPGALSGIAASLSSSCKEVMRWHPEGIVSDVAAALYKLGITQSLTLPEKADILMRADDPNTVNLLDCFMCKRSLYSILSFVINDNPSKILLMASALLRRSQNEKSIPLSERKVVRLMLWFSIISVYLLHGHGHDMMISRLIEIYTSHSEQLLMERAWDDNMQQTEIHTGFLPLLISVVVLCPTSTPAANSIVTPAVEAALLSILDKAPEVPVPQPFPVCFETTQACDVVPTSPNTPFKFRLDYAKASTVFITRETPSSVVTVLTSNSSDTRPTKFVLNDETPFAKVSGSSLVLFGTDESSLTIACSYNLHVGTPWSSILREGVLNLLIATSRHLTAPPKPCDVFLAPLLRHGLDTRTLSAHGMDVPGRVNEFSFAVDILNNVGEGEEFVNEVWNNMKGNVTPPMRPAIQALLSLLIHSGLNPQQAEDELRLRWFSGEWGSRLQGVGKDAARQSLVTLAKWITSSVFCQCEASTLYIPRVKSGWWSTAEAQLSASISTSDLRDSTTSRRSTLRSVMQSQDILDQVRAFFTKGITPSELESIMAERTRAALSTIRALHLLSSILSRIRGHDPWTLHRILQVLWVLCGEGSGKHMVEALVGSGTELELQVRSEFHLVVEKCQTLLVNTCPKDISPKTLLNTPAKNGCSTILLLAIMCHPWDTVDCELFKCDSKDESGMSGVLKHLEEHMTLPIYTSPLKTQGVHECQQDVSEKSTVEDRAFLHDLIGATEHFSINCILPNDFSIIMPNLVMSTSVEGIAVETSVSDSLVLRADEAWPVSHVSPWFCGIPRVFYFEVKLTLPCHRIAICLSHGGSASSSVDVAYFYENTGATHDISCSPFEEGDTVGCGVVATTRQIFFTLNGIFISFMGTVHERTEAVFPTIRINNNDRASFTVNFGSNAFCYDFRRRHPVFAMRSGPTWCDAASTAEVVFHYLTARACCMQDSCQSSARYFLIKCCEMVCQNINKVVSSVVKADGGNSVPSEGNMHDLVTTSLAKASLVRYIATLRHIMQAKKLCPLPETVSEMLFGAVTVLMMFPLPAVQISTINILPVLIPHIRRLEDASASESLVRILFRHAKASTNACSSIPFSPNWRKCDLRCMSIAHMQVAHMQIEAQRSVVLGNVLPWTGVVSFAVRVLRKGMLKGHSLKGGYYIGVAVASFSPLTPTSTSQNWKTAKPPIVWALHDASPQLPHATNPTVKSNNFHRAFGSGDVVRVVVDFDRQTVSFFRNSEFLKTLFTDIPSGVDLVPFVQLYNDDASVSISRGEMTPPISSATLLSASSVDVLRCMLTLEPFESLVADGLCRELDEAVIPSVSLAVFKSTPDPRVLRICNRNGENILVTVSRLTQQRAKFSVGNVAYYEYVSNLCAPSFMPLNSVFQVTDPSVPLSGLRRSIASLVAALHRRVSPLVTTKALSVTEAQQRREILEEEKDQWDYMFYDTRVNQFLCIQRHSQNITLLEAPQIKEGYTFSPSLSHPSFEFSSRFCGRLATVPSGAENATIPFIAIAEPAVPLTGRFNLRYQLLRGSVGQILGGGYYVGLCVSSFDWKRCDLNVDVPEVWAIHDMDDTHWRLRHLCTSTRFHITAEPSCIIVSGDIIRLEVDRDEGTIYAYRKGVNQEEVVLGLIFDNLPKNTELFSFVHLFNTDAVAVLLSSCCDEPAIRTTVQEPRFALSLSTDKRNCDSCVARHLENSRFLQVRYKCNECIDYILCKPCFDLCMHSHHSFTELGEEPLVYSNSPPVNVTIGMKVVIPASSSLYLHSRGCSISEKHMNCVAEARECNAMAMWGIVFKRRATFTVTVSTLNGEPLCPDSPVFVGIAGVDEVVSSAEVLRTLCMSGAPNVVSICSNSSLNRTITPLSRSTCSFQSGSIITIDVEMESGVALIRRDWVTLGTKTFSTSPLSNPTYLVGFVLFGQKNTIASIYPEKRHTFYGVIEDVSSRFLRVGCHGCVRLIRMEHCRVPLSLCRAPPKVDTLGYIFVKRDLVQGKIIDVEGDEALLHVHGEDGVRRVPYLQLLVDQHNSIAKEGILCRNAGENGVAISDGFVISRLLFILTYFCEKETLSPLVLMHSPALIGILSLMASVKISNDVPIKFIEEIRAAITATSRCFREMTGKGYIGELIPVPVIQDSQYIPKQGMLMCAVKGPYKGNIFSVVSVEACGTMKGTKLYFYSSSSSSLKGGMTTVLNTADCIPVKQCNGRPWWTINNGLPCSLLEHTLRVSCSECGSMNIVSDGDWQGEIIVPKRGNGSISLHLDSNFTGSAVVIFPSFSLECSVFWEYVRYSRRVRLCLFNAIHEDKWCKFRLQNADLHLSFAAALVQLDAFMLGCEGPGFVVVMDGIIDREGRNVYGAWKPRHGRSGTFSINLLRQIPLAPPTTDVAHIEPLPDCKDPFIPPPPQRDVEVTLHRLVVLLARHLYLCILDRGGGGAVAIHDIVYYHSHPLADRLISTHVDISELLITVYKTLYIILDPATKPWDSTTLSLLILKCILLRPEIITEFSSFVWDSFHAVVAATNHCGVEYRHYLLNNIILFVENHRCGFDNIYIQLFSTLLTWVDRRVSNFLSSFETRKDVAAGVELSMSLGSSIITDTIHHIPLTALQCLIDMAHSFREGLPLPKLVDTVRGGCEEEDVEEMKMSLRLPVEAFCVFGEFSDGVLKVGKVVSSYTAGVRGKYYYEVVLSDKLSTPFAVGWGTDQHTEVPCQHVGSDTCSFAFTGSEVASKNIKEEYRFGQAIKPRSVVGCLLDMDEKIVAWSVNGVYGPFLSIPIEHKDHALYAFTSTGSCNGMRVSFGATQFEYVPDGYSDLSGRYTRVQVSRYYNSAARSLLPIRPLSFYRQLASYLSDLEELAPLRTSLGNSSCSTISSTVLESPEVTLLRRYPSILHLSDEERKQSTRVICVVESCMATARRFIDLDSEIVEGRLLTAFLLMRHVVRRSLGRKLLVSIPPVESNPNPPSITVRITELYSTLARTPEVALKHSVLSQIYRQIGSFTDSNFRQSPLFKVHLYITNSGHAPQDLGGPYRQLWTFLSEEIMAHPDKCYPHNEYHRNPLFRYVNNSQRVALVPDCAANSAYDLVLLKFLGQIMGHVAAAGTPLALDFSPFVWKYLVEDTLTVQDYYKYVDSVVEKSMEDAGFLMSEMAEEIIPNLGEMLLGLLSKGGPQETVVGRCRQLAEECLVHSMDPQLVAMREGLLSVLPRRVTRCLSWRELERMVCGNSNLTADIMRQWIEVQLQPPRDQTFWRIMDELGMEQRSSFFCFASGQKRPPLIRRIRVMENAESTEHLPRAQSCSSLVTVPPYDTYELFKDKLLMAIAHQMEMELA